MRTWRPRLRRLLRRYPFARIVAFILTLWVVAAVFLRLTEGAENAEFNSMPKAAWNIAVYLFSGLDSGVPQTTVGRVIVTIVLVLSLGVVAVFTGSIASFLVERRLGDRRRMPNHELSDHIVLCNWNDKGIPIIRELHAPIVQDRRPIVVISASENAADLPDEDDLPEFEDVYLVKGDAANEIILKRANVHDAHSVVVLADPAEGDLADAKSILICMAVGSACREAGAQKTHICVEGVSPQNVDHLRRAGADEIVAASDFAMMLLAQSTLFHGLSTVYRNLLTVSAESNEVYMVPVPDAFIGKTFAELGAAMLANRDTDNPAILIGAVTERGITINPKPGVVAEFTEGDRAVVIAFERPQSLV